MADVLRYTAFSADPAGGNPAGVVLDARGLDDADMLAIAAEVGYSESAFVTRDSGDGALEIRYFSPLAEVPFCGHATIATGVAWAERHGPGHLRLQTRSGEVTLDVAPDGAAGRLIATLTSVAPRVEPIAAGALAELLAALGWEALELDPGMPPRVGYAGAFHPVVAAGSRERLGRLDYDFPRLQALMAQRDWTTVQLVWRQDPTTFHARDPFPPGGVVEDPATGAAAAAFGAYLRELRLVKAPASVTIHQGDDLGRPSVLRVDIPVGAGTGISVSGTAVAL